MPDAIYRILAADDDEVWLASTKELLDDEGLRVDTTPSTAGATALVAASVYDAVLFDVRFNSRPIGDRWVLEHLGSLGGAVVVIVTGHRDEIADPHALIARGVRIITKGGEEQTELQWELKGRARQKWDMLNSPRHAATAVANESERVFLNWLARLGGSDIKNTVIGGHSYSLSDLRREVEAGSDLGKRLLLMYTRHVERLINRTGLHHGH